MSVATIGLAAWVWSERQSDEDDEDDLGREHGERRGDGPPLPPDAPGFPGGPGSQFPEHARDLHEDDEYDDSGMIGRMQGALRRTPSPQQIFDGASKRVAAGVAAAGAVVGGALTSIREEDRDAFNDHSRWSEEAASRGMRPGIGDSSVMPTRPPPVMEKRQKSVAIVVSSVSPHGDSQDPDSHHSEHAVCFPFPNKEEQPD